VVRTSVFQDRRFPKGGCDFPGALRFAPRAFRSRIAGRNARGGGGVLEGLGKSKGFNFKKSLVFTGLARFPLFKKIDFRADKIQRSLAFSGKSRGRLSNFWNIWKVEMRFSREFLKSACWDVPRLENGERNDRDLPSFAERNAVQAVGKWAKNRAAGCREVCFSEGFYKSTPR
jgi:hypothetical protein